MSKECVIHCKPEALNLIKENDLQWDYSLQFGKNEIDVIAVDNANLDDEDFIDSLGLDYELVNCIEAL